jgi:hypothetical protein
MGRSVSRFSLLIGSAVAAGSLLAGCAADAPGAAVIVPPAREGLASVAVPGDFLASLEQAVASELSAINSTQSDNEPPEVILELTALNNEGSLIAAENFGSLITTAANQIAKRERLVNALTADIKNSTYLGGVDVNGTPLANTLLALLSNVNADLQAQASSVDAAQLPNQLRAVILSIGPSTRVFGLVEPMIHLAIAAGDELNGANLLEVQYQTLYKKVIVNNEGTEIASETAHVMDLKNQIATLTADATADANTVLALTPAGYPGNKATIQNVRAQELQLKAPLGPLTIGQDDVNYIDQYLPTFSS